MARSELLTVFSFIKKVSFTVGTCILIPLSKDAFDLSLKHGHRLLYSKITEKQSRRINPTKYQQREIMSRLLFLFHEEIPKEFMCAFENLMNYLCLVKIIGTIQILII